jgi:hypothetical protein
MGESTHDTTTLLAEGPELTDGHGVIDAAVLVIDQALSTLLQRELVSADEVTDVLLDVRSALLTPAS